MKKSIFTIGLICVAMLLCMPSLSRAQLVINVGINQPPAPVSAFSQTVNGLSLDFTDLSTTNISAWAWDFGDGNTSTQQNPSHTYTVAGNYTVCLTVTDVNGCTDSTCAPTGVLVGISQATLFSGLEAFPNPYRDKVRIRYHLKQQAPVSLRVLDVLGKEVAVLAEGTQSPGTKEYEFSAQSMGLEAGIYFIVLEANGQKAVQKLIEL